MKTIYQISAGGIVYKKIRNSFTLEGKSEIRILWLICQHSQHKGWVFPKGLVGDQKINEPMEEAALREVKEEGGVEAKIINSQPIKTEYSYIQTSFAKAPEVKVKKTVYYFLMEYISGNPEDHDWEMTEAKFVTEEEVVDILTYVSDREAFKKVLDILHT